MFDPQSQIEEVLMFTINKSHTLKKFLNDFHDSKKCFLTLILGGFLLISGCATFPTEEVIHRKITENDAVDSKDITENKYVEDREKMFGHEWADGIPPELGICLSGGGVRSASFSIGALEGLYKSGVLAKAEII